MDRCKRASDFTGRTLGNAFGKNLKKRIVNCVSGLVILNPLQHTATFHPFHPEFCHSQISNVLYLDESVLHCVPVVGAGSSAPSLVGQVRNHGSAWLRGQRGGVTASIFCRVSRFLRDCWKLVGSSAIYIWSRVPCSYPPKLMIWSPAPLPPTSFQH